MTSVALAVALRARLQVDQHAAAVQRRVGAVDADERRQALDRRILQDRPRASACWRSAIAANEIVCGASEMPWITPVSCTGKNPFGIDDVEHDREHQRGERDDQRRGLAVEHPRQHARRSRRSRGRTTRRSCGRSGPARAPARGAGAARTSSASASARPRPRCRMATASVIANSRNSRPTTSPMNSSGISTAISENVSEMMVKPICSEPFERGLRAAARPPRCSARCSRSSRSRRRRRSRWRW